MWLDHKAQGWLAASGGSGGGVFYGPHSPY